MYAISTIFYNKTATSSCPFNINICFASSTDHNIVQEEPVQGLFLCSFFYGGLGSQNNKILQPSMLYPRKKYFSEMDKD